MGRTAFVTGAGGFVGANLCRRLLADGHDVHAVVRAGSEPWRLADVRLELRELSAIDLRDPVVVQAALDEADPEWIFHLAAHGAYSWQTAVEAIFATNTLASVQLIETACARGFEAFILAGSSSEYGLKDHPPDEQEALEPNSAYAVSKAAATMFGRWAARERGMAVATLRLYSAYGRWEEPNRLLPALAVYGRRRRLPPLADPRIARDFVFVDDVCDAFVRAAGAGARVAGAVFNVASGRQTTLAELVEVVRRELEIDEQPQWGTMAARTWDTSNWVGDSERIRRELGWAASTTLADGFHALIEWLELNPALSARYERAIGLAT